MVPTLDIGREILTKNNFINAYSEDIDCNLDYKNVVFLLFKPEDMNVFKEFLEKEYTRTTDIIEDYDYKEGYVVVIYQLNPEFEKDFETIKKGKYSKTSKEFQSLFPKTIKDSVTLQDSPSIQHLIFSKDQKLVEFWENIIGNYSLSTFGMEVWTGFVPHNETLYIKDYYTNEKNTK